MYRKTTSPGCEQIPDLNRMDRAYLGGLTIDNYIYSCDQYPSNHFQYLLN
jgi:hypothetical protein